jgi:hypothetical protein
MNLVQIQERLKDLPTQAIMGYANGQNPQVPPYLALGELNRRKQMEQKAAQPPQGTVKDNIEQEVGMMEMQKMRQMATPQMPPQMPQQMPQMPPQGAPAMPDAAMAMAAGGLARLPIREMNFGSGGIIAFAEGGDEGEELTKAEAKAILKRMKQREGTESRDVVEPPPEVDNTIPGFEAGNRYAQEMDKVNRRPTRLTPQQMEANVKQPDLAEQIPGQRSQAPASTGSMPGEVERNIGNTMGAMPGASAAKGFQGGARGLMALLGNLPNMLRGSSGQGGEAPMGDADQNLGAAIMAQAKEKPQAAAPVAAPISRPTSQMTPQQMERAMTNAPAQGVASLPSVAPQRAPAPQRPPVAAPPPAKSAAELFQEKILSGVGLPALPGEYEPPKQAPIAEEYLKYMADREGTRKEGVTKFEQMQQDRARRDLFNSLIAGGEATRGRKGIGALLGGTGQALGESLTASEERAMAFQQKQQDLADNDAKTKYEIANLRRAEERGDSKAVYESKIKLSELGQQRNQLQSQVANAMSQNESTERIARQNNLTQLEVARINQATAMKPGETERLMQQYADIKRSRGEAAAEEFMKTVERTKFGNKPQLGAEANAIKRLALAEKDDNYKMQARIADDPSKKPEARAKAQEIMNAIERRNGIIDSSGGPTVGSVQEGFRFKGGNPADKNNWEKV